MQDTSYPSVEQMPNDKLKSLVRLLWSIRWSLVGASLLLFWDVASGSFVMSVLSCPVWFCISIVKGAIERVGWRPILLRIAIPVLTLGVVLANNAIQLKIAKTRASQVIAACESFHTVNGKYPKSLDELVPQYMSSVPRAKYCLMYGEFVYLHNDGHPMLMWCVLPPFGRRIYDFERRLWSYLD